MATQKQLKALAKARKAKKMMGNGILDKAKEYLKKTKILSGAILPAIKNTLPSGILQNLADKGINWVAKKGYGKKTMGKGRSKLEQGLINMR